MNPKDRVRVTFGSYAGRVGTVVGRCIGTKREWVIRLDDRMNGLIFHETEFEPEVKDDGDSE